MKNIILIGFMGSGKTTVGKALANKLALGHIDMDDLIESNEGKSINQIFEDGGEEQFRELETTYLEKLLTKKNKIISTGGGIILKEHNISVLKTIGTIVFLHADRNQLIDNLKNNASRPLLQGDYVAKIDKLLEQREAIYLNTADIIIQTTGKDIENIADEIVSII